MFKDNKLRKILFGNYVGFGKKIDRGSALEYQIAKNGDKYRLYKFRSDDGLFLCLIEMIEKLEERIKLLENKKTKTN